MKRTNEYLHKYKDHLFFGKEVNILEKYKQINDIQVGTVHSHIENNNGDNLVLTRKLNHPELIFNQRISDDDDFDRRFFKVDANECWTLSPKNECYICEKYHYTMIFYERSKLS